MDKLDLQTPDFTQQNIEKLAELFPNCVTESRDAKGQLKKAIDFEQLKQELSQDSVEGSQERYQLNWPGKREALVTANTPINKTLRPCREDSVDFDSTQNLYIEGDNLEALKLLQETYLDKVKMIYIDPPYNTGNDFIYNDRFTPDKQDYEEDAGLRDEDGHRLLNSEQYQKNQDSKGRFHSDWLSMMYPRLKLARNLLRDDGVIFISIDDGEVANLRKVCDEVFGIDNFIAMYIHKNNSSKNQATLVSVSTEYFLCYSKKIEEIKKTEWKLAKKGAGDIAKLFNKLKLKGLPLAEIEAEIKEMYRRPKYSHLSRWNKVDDAGVFKDADLSREGGPKDYTINNPNSNQPCVIPNRGWGKSYDELLRLQKEGLIWYGDEDTSPGLKDYINPDDVSVPDSFWYFDNSVDTRWIKNAFGDLVFDNPKPIEMIKNIIEMIGLENGDIVLDFFAGSATTAHALIEANNELDKNCKFIMVQLPENLDITIQKVTGNSKKTIQNAIRYLDKKGLPHFLTEVSKERVRLAAESTFPRVENTSWNNDTGFRVLKIDSTNMNDVYITPDQLQHGDLHQFADNIKTDRSAEDLLFQVLLDWGVDLTLPIAEESIAGKPVLFVDDNALAACFEQGIDEDFVKSLAKREPLRVVFRDDGFASDSVKINVAEIFKMLSPHTEIKVI